MLWLLVTTLSGAVLVSAPRADGASISDNEALPRPSRSELHLLLRAPDRRVRSTDARLAKMLAHGARRSPTFAGLLAALDRTDVIVYIEPANDLPRKLDGRLALLPITNSQRYLRIEVRHTLPREELVPLIAHELRHALEIAAAPEVRDEASMILLYQRIGALSGGSHSYDTAAARSTGQIVRSELIG